MINCFIWHFFCFSYYSLDLKSQYFISLLECRCYVIVIDVHFCSLLLIQNKLQSNGID